MKTISYVIGAALVMAAVFMNFEDEPITQQAEFCGIIGGGFMCTKRP